MNNKVIQWFGGPTLFYYSVIWLIVILIMGTYAQKELGLYLAQKIYFSSVFIWVGVVPLPGGLLTLGFTLLGLFCQIILNLQMKALDRLSLTLIHAGAFCLLISGFWKAITAEEGTLFFYEGETVQSFYHPQELELALIDTSPSKYDDVTVIQGKTLKPGTIELPHHNLQMEILSFFRNAQISGEKIIPLPLIKDFETNQAKIELKITSLDSTNPLSLKHILSQNSQYPYSFRWKGKRFALLLRNQKTILPFSLQLVTFTKELHPGTVRPKSFSSEVIIKDNGLEQRSLIRMNEPLRYKGYTFYQSSYQETPDKKDMSILAISRYQGGWLNYLAFILLGLGLLVRFRQLAIPTFSMGLLFFLPTLLLSTPPSWEEIPILHGGRIKTFDSFSRVILKQQTGKEKIDNQLAHQWIQQIILEPDKSLESPLFMIKNQEILDALSLPKKPAPHLYHFIEISNAYSSLMAVIPQLAGIKRSERTPAQNGLIDLYEQILQFYQLTRSLTLFRPQITVDSQKLANALQLPYNTPLSYYEIYPKYPLFKKLLDQKGELQKELQELGSKLDEIEIDSGSTIFRVIPSKQKEGEWISPWKALQENPASPFLKKWSEHFHLLDEQSITTLKKEYLPYTTTWRLSIELFYHQLQTFPLALSLYIISFLFLSLSALRWKASLFTKLAVFSLLIGFITHVIGITLRCLITGRPPVATLYESLLFVSLIGVLAGILLSLLSPRLKSWGLLISTLLGTTLLLLSFSYEREGETMDTLVAVLNTQFWLSTHVITITIGYGVSLVASLMAHFYLIHSLFVSYWPERFSAQLNKELFHSLRRVILYALFFTALGTILGGLWADESWGRFWGWDPKENGALLIVLWLLLILHGLKANRLTPLQFSALTALTSIVVGLAWFGVNILSVGLHSYGFTENASWSLLLFVSLECLTILVLMFWSFQKNSSDKKKYLTNLIYSPHLTLSIMVMAGAILLVVDYNKLINNTQEITTTEKWKNQHSVPSFKANTLEGKEFSFPLTTPNPPKIILLNFWASWCATCFKEFPAMANFALQKKGEVLLITITSDQKKEDALYFLNRVTQRIPKLKKSEEIITLWDSTGYITKELFSISQLPQTIIIKDNKVMVDKIIGAEEWVLKRAQKRIEHYLSQ